MTTTSLQHYNEFTAKPCLHTAAHFQSVGDNRPAIRSLCGTTTSGRGTSGHQAQRLYLAPKQVLGLASRSKGVSKVSVTAMSKLSLLFVCGLSACFQTRWVETTPQEFKSASFSSSHVEQYRPEIKAHIDQVNGFRDSIVWLTSDWGLVRHELSGALLRRLLTFEFAGMTSTGTCLVGKGRFSQERIGENWSEPRFNHDMFPTNDADERFPDIVRYNKSVGFSVFTTTFQTPRMVGPSAQIDCQAFRKLAR